MFKKRNILVFSLFAIVIILSMIIFSNVFFLSFKLDEERTVAKENLFTIVAGGTVEEAKEILDKYPDLINEREKSSNFFAHITDSGNKTLLLRAIQHHALNDNSEMIEFLIDRGADVNASNGTKPVYPIIEILWRGSEDRYEIA